MLEFPESHIESRKDGWYYYDETLSNADGPHSTRDQAVLALGAYSFTLGDAATKLLKKLDAWKRLALARSKILSAYQLLRQPSGKALDDARAARDKLHALGEDKA